MTQAELQTITAKWPHVHSFITYVHDKLPSPSQNEDIITQILKNTMAGIDVDVSINFIINNCYTKSCKNSYLSKGGTIKPCIPYNGCYLIPNYDINHTNAN